MKKKLRLSYSFLNLWERGEIDKAISLYFHKPLPTTKQMDDGKRIHQEMADEISKTNKLPDYLDCSIELSDPLPENKIVTPYNDRWDMSGIIDCLDNSFFVELKTGKTPITSYTRRRQIPFYFLLLDKAGHQKDKAFLIKYNQYTNKSELFQFWRNDMMIDDVKNYIDTIAPEIETFFEQQGYIS